MKRIIILISLPYFLFSNSITYEEFENKALENSFSLIELEEKIKIDENTLREYKYPGLLNIQSTFSPYYTFSSDGDTSNDFEYGSLGLSFTPYHNVSLGTTYNKEKRDETSVGVSFYPLKSKRELNSKKNLIEINKVKYSEERRKFNKTLKTIYNNLYFLREKTSLTQNYLDQLAKKIEQEENKIDKGLGDRIKLNDLFSELLENERKFYDDSLKILEKESEVYKISGVNIESLNMEPLFLDFNLSDQVIIKTISEYLDESEYLYLEESIRDQKVAITDTKKGFLPELEIFTGVETEDFSDFVGRISLKGTIRLDFNYLTKIENQKLILSKLEREKAQKVKEYNEKVEFDKRKVEITQKRIERLSKSLDFSNNTLEADKFRLEKGDILLEDYKFTEIQNKRILLDLNETKSSFILEYLTKY